MTEVAMTGTADSSEDPSEEESSLAAAMPPTVIGRRMYNEEYVRLASYNTMTPLEGCHPVLMARAGLYYTGPHDAIQCFSCSTVLSNWRSQGIDPVKLHRQTAPDCQHSRGEDVTNAAIAPPTDAATVASVKEMLRRRCAELDENPTQVYYDICRSFSEIGGVSRGEMFAAGGGAGGGLESEASASSNVSSEPAAVGPVVPPAGFGAVGAGNMADDAEETESPGDRTLPTSAPSVDLELCKASVTERLKTFERWPIAAQVHPLHLAEAGFVYTGPQDRVQCVHCEGSLRNWQAGDSPAEEHARHFPTCPMILGSSQASSISGEGGGGAGLPLAAVAAGGIVVGGSGLAFERGRNTPPPIAGAGPLSDATPPLCRRELLGIVTDRPKHPHMAVEAVRIGSYSSWPTGKSQTPQQLSKAGFFYAGFNDSVKCFFCDGGLRNWEREDDPWHEHARWFPRCKYVRQVKGDHFVEQVLAQESGRVQQTATYEERGIDPSVEGGERVERRRSRSGSAGREGRGERGGQPVVEAREVMARMDTAVVRAVLNMDIPQDLVRRAIEHRLRNTGDDFPNMEALLETVFELSASHHTPVRHAAAAGEPCALIQNTGSPSRRAPPREAHVAEAPRSLIEENRQLKEQRTCKICMDEEVCVVFVPCGHLVCCATCAPPLSKCPICRSTIRGTVRTYMS